ncbi:uncharacterized protein LOC123683087 [Harmonia axyridis]|uniref:uncharacterized protein LOC123683087 n=1 Tax=Harmonia axyridis TaxID=115357 RepID=UPI001E2787A8|nr:uncharacterized protein LOC123683087 [Harmonia axyridis]
MEKVINKSDGINNKRWNLSNLEDDNIKQRYQTRLDEYLTAIEDIDTESMYEKIKEALQNSATEVLGELSSRKSKALWWNNEIEELVNQKNKAYLKWLTTKEQRDRESYLEAKSKTRRKVNNAKRSMWDRKCKEIGSLLGGRKTAESWRFINALKSPSKNSANIDTIPMNNWVTHYKQLLTETRQGFLAPSISSHIDIEGPGGVPAELIKHGTHNLFQAVTDLINKCLSGQPVPKEWKTAYISSIYKKGDKNQCANYRGISVTSTFSRIYGRILRDLIEIEYSAEEEEEQSGFRAGRSCTDNCTSEETLGNSTRNEHQPNILITALKNLYTDSTSRIKSGKNLSQEFTVNKGLRQGCCVSPTLFKVYVSRALRKWKNKCGPMEIELDDNSHLYSLQFADDQVIMANDKDDLEYMARKLQEE